MKLSKAPYNLGRGGASEPPEYYLSQEELDRMIYTEEELYEIWLKEKKERNESTKKSS